MAQTKQLQEGAECLAEFEIHVNIGQPSL